MKDCSSIKRDHPLQHFTCDVYREGGGHEVRRRIVQPNVSAVPHRIVLEPNLHYGCQDTTSSDARTSLDHSSKHRGTYNECCRGEMDFRIQGLRQSAVQQHDHIRKETVQKLIHQFDTRPNKEALQAELKRFWRSIHSASSRRK